VLCEANWMIE